LDELKVLDAMEAAERLAEGVGLVIGYRVDDEYQQQLQRVRHEKLFRISRDCSKIKWDSPGGRVVFEDLGYILAGDCQEDSADVGLTVFKSEQIKLSTAWRLHCVVM
jgi:hypothetical protein